PAHDGAERVAQRRQARGLPQDVGAQGGRRVRPRPRPRAARARGGDREVAHVARRTDPRSVHPQPLSRVEVLADRPDDGHFGEDRGSAPQPGPSGPAETAEGLPLNRTLYPVLRTPDPGRIPLPSSPRGRRRRGTRNCGVRGTGYFRTSATFRSFSGFGSRSEQAPRCFTYSTLLVARRTPVDVTLRPLSFAHCTLAA